MIIYISYESTKDEGKISMIVRNKRVKRTNHLLGCEGIGWIIWAPNTMFPLT